MARKTNFSKESVGLAGEYAVASELCKRGFYAQLTLGNHKKTDLLVETDDHLFRVSVKSKTGYEWPSVKGITGTDLLVFVDFKSKDEYDRPDFYVLTADHWKEVIKEVKKEKPDSKIDQKTNTVFWEPWSATSKGWVGCSIRVKHVEKYKDNWPSL